MSTYCPACGEVCEIEERYEVEDDKEYAYAVSTCCGAVMPGPDEWDDCPDNDYDEVMGMWVHR